MIIIGIDPGTSCGWAMTDDRGTFMGSGTWSLKGGRFEGAGMRFLRLRRYLREIIGKHVGLLAYEEVRGHKGTDAAHIYGGCVAVITEECEAMGIPYVAIPVGTIKKFATGKGNANKAAMLAAARDAWPLFDGDDNEADARWIASCAREQFGTKKETKRCWMTD